jgi:hypothetical protein
MHQAPRRGLIPMNAARTKHPIDPPPEDVPGPVDAPEIAVLLATIATLTAKVAERDAKINDLLGPDQWLALLACDRGGYTAEALRGWCIDGTVDAYQIGSRWFVSTRSLRRHLARLGLARAIRQA